ncbi:MAG: hypothetical protein JNM46_07105, partial [Anaerolineales bacterium]|nr:hypothetical protein [Anaerolineales bacterium]
MRKYWMQITGGSLGLIFVLSMLFANQLGLDNNQVWGMRRYVIFFAGIFLLIISIFYRENNFIGKMIETNEGKLKLSAIGLNIFIFLIYLWYASVGKWEFTYNETSYFDLLASAFRQGQTALQVQPDPALLTFTDESLYEPANREGIPVLWDATLYEGKYYLYWGPAPALVLTFVKFFYAGEIGDRFLTLFFISGTLIFLNLIIFDLRKTYFNHIPNWAVLFAIVFAGLVNPMPYILVEGRIYEAAIIAAQFFLITGFYFLFTVFNKPNLLRIFLAGLFFAFAVGSRTTLLFAVVFTALIFLFWVIKLQKEKLISFIIAFAFPLAMGAIAYAAYNYARFDSLTEFGYRYQLTSYNLYEKLDETFSLSYIPPNFYKLLFNPLERREAFPYIFPTRWDGPDWLESNRGFYLLKAEEITGLLISSPFLLFIFFAKTQSDKKNYWVNLSLVGSSILLFITLQAFFFTAMRYLLDLIPT